MDSDHLDFSVSSMLLEKDDLYTSLSSTSPPYLFDQKNSDVDSDLEMGSKSSVSSHGRSVSLSLPPNRKVRRITGLGTSGVDHMNCSMLRSQPKKENKLSNDVCSPSPHSLSSLHFFTESRFDASVLLRIAHFLPVSHSSFFL
jgi:hypothetical protein